MVDNFGEFGKETVKHQLLISNIFREELIAKEDPCLLYEDTKPMKSHLSPPDYIPSAVFNDVPSSGQTLSLSEIKNRIADKIIGLKVEAGATKNRGQALELICLNLLGYKVDKNDLLEGGYPDIYNQMLEVKIQDTQTVDLGMYTPEFPDLIVDSMGITTEDVRYLIALTDSDDGIIKGLILCPGVKLGKHFTYVSDKSYKCQRSIPMDFFEKYKGQAVFNP